MNIPRTLIVGIGSPHGDDQTGWLLADLLAMDARHAFEVRKAKTPIRLLDWLDKVGRLIICDACRGLGRVGKVRRWTWPTSDLPELAWSGTHDLTLPAVLTLADRLGRLPKQVVLWVIEGAASDVVATLSVEVTETMPELVNQIVRELNGQESLPAEACTSSR
jgi:hydrogenase maturation protease